MRILFLLFCLPLCSLSSYGQLSVRAGFIDLHLGVGGAADVWADTPTEGLLFDHWKGATGTLVDPNAWHTTVDPDQLPPKNASVTAVYQSAPVWTPISLTATPPGSSAPLGLSYYFPKKPLGVIFFFHGTGGSGASFFSNVETLQFAREAVAAGFAVSAQDCSDRVNGTWDDLYAAENVDVQNVRSVISYFIRQGLMTKETPKFAAGMSNGGTFSPKPAYFLHFQGNAIWCAGGAPADVFQSTTVPTIWSLALNDDLYEHTTFLNNATHHQEDLEDRGVPAVLLPEHQPSPVYPQRFTRVPGILLGSSQTIFDRLKNGGYLDQDNYLREDPETSGWATILPLSLQFYTKDIGDQLACCYSGHKFFSEYDHTVLSFFKQHIDGQ